MNFEQALTKVKAGFKIARTGWNGAGQFVYFIPADDYPGKTEIGKQIAREFDGLVVPYGAYLAIKTTQNVVVPWLASQGDLLAEDWEVVE